jgi:hypothetical protein
MMDILAWLLARLADFQRLIEYFGIGAIFIWLYFLERGDRVDVSEGQQAQEHIDGIAKYYQTSWVLFGIAVLAEYALTEESLTKLFGTTALALVNYIAIIFGLVMFTVPSYVVYGKISGHKSYAIISVPEVAEVLYAVSLGLMHTALLWGLLSAGVNETGRILVVTILISYFGIVASVTKWGKRKGWHKRLAFILTTLPWVMLSILIIQTFLSYLLGY